MSIEFVIELIDKITKPAGSASKGVDDLKDKLGGLDEAASGGGESIGGMEGALGGLAGGATVAAAAIAVAAAAIGALLYEGAKLALEASDFREDTLMTLEALEGSKEAADATFEQINSISDRLGVSRESTAKLATQLVNAGVEDGQRLNDSIEAVSNLQAALGAGAAGKIVSIIERASAAGHFEVSAKQLMGTGVTFETLAKRLDMSVPKLKAAMKAGTITVDQGLEALNESVNDRLGGIAKAQGLDLENQFTRFRNNISKLFETVKTGPFLEALSGIVKMFDQSTTTGKALKFLATSIFDGLFAAGTAVMPVVKGAIEDIIIAALRLYIAAKPLVANIEQLFASGGKDTISTALSGVIWIMEAGLMVTGGIITAFVILGLGAKELANDVATGFASIVKWVVDVYNKITEFFTGEDLGKKLIDGLIAGITGGAGGVLGAMSSLIGGVIGTSEDKLKVHSPSKVFEDMGAFTAEGFAQGVDSGAANANASMTDMVQPPSLSAAPSSSAGGTSGAITINVEVNAGSAGSPEAVGQAVADKIADLFESLAIQQGAAA